MNKYTSLYIDILGYITYNYGKVIIDYYDFTWIDNNHSIENTSVQHRINNKKG